MLSVNCQNHPPQGSPTSTNDSKQPKRLHQIMIPWFPSHPPPNVHDLQWMPISSEATCELKTCRQSLTGVWTGLRKNACVPRGTVQVERRLPLVLLPHAQGAVWFCSSELMTHAGAPRSSAKHSNQSRGVEKRNGVPRRYQQVTIPVSQSVLQRPR